MNKILLYIFIFIALAACTNDLPDDAQAEQGRVTITSDIAPFTIVPAVDGGDRESEPALSAVEGSSLSSSFMSRVNVAGNDFIDEEMSGGKIVRHGDYIRLKIICPFVSTTERGETTHGYSYDALYFLKRVGGQWAQVVALDSFDITGSYSYSASPNIASYYEAQQTPYVYVATSISEERRFVAPNGNGGTSLYDHLTPVFHADQKKEKHYRASDVLWAQTFMQTGAWNIHLGFQHKMACLDITIDDAALTDKISDNAVLTLEGMPDIDQAEIVVGDYYADASKINSGYGYRQKSSCSYENNGRVLGIAVNHEAAGRAKVWPMSGNPSNPDGAYSAVFNPGGGVTTVPNTGTYTAFREGAKHYRLIVPPCHLDPDVAADTESSKHAVFWLRDGTRRFKVTLSRLQFEEGKLYPVTLKLSDPTIAPEPDSEPDPEPEPEPEP